MAFIGIRYELGQAIGTSYDADSILKAQPDGLGPSPKLGSYEVLHPLGFSSRPRDPDTDSAGKAHDGGGCNLRIGRDGTDIKVEFMGDARALAGIPPLNEGSSVQYAHTADGKPSFHVIDGDDGTHQIYVEVGNSAHVITIGKDGNGESVLNITHADGMALELFKKKAIIKNAAGDCFIELNESGGTLNGNWKVVGDISDSTGISLLKHTHLTALGPSGPPLPSL